MAPYTFTNVNVKTLLANGPNWGTCAAPGCSFVGPLPVEYFGSGLSFGTCSVAHWNANFAAAFGSLESPFAEVDFMRRKLEGPATAGPRNCDNCGIPIQHYVIPAERQFCCENCAIEFHRPPAIRPLLKMRIEDVERRSGAPYVPGWRRRAGDGDGHEQEMRRPKPGRFAYDEREKSPSLIDSIRATADLLEVGRDLAAGGSDRIAFRGPKAEAVDARAKPCPNCEGPLLDDAVGPFCSQRCHDVSIDHLFDGVKPEPVGPDSFGGSDYDDAIALGWKPADADDDTYVFNTAAYPLPTPADCAFCERPIVSNIYYMAGDAIVCSATCRRRQLVNDREKAEAEAQQAETRADAIARIIGEFDKRATKRSDLFARWPLMYNAIRDLAANSEPVE